MALHVPTFIIHLNCFVSAYLASHCVANILHLDVNYYILCTYICMHFQFNLEHN